jgi:putative transposase
LSFPIPSNCISNGTTLENPGFLRGSLKRLRVEQRKLNRRLKKGAKEQSKSYQKLRLVVAKLHEHIRNQRKDYLHKISTRIIRFFDTICLEDLNIQGLMQNQNLALVIGEVGWHKFKRMLEYKAAWQGKNILYIGRFQPSSKLCSHCGTIFNDLSLKHRSWRCASCGTHHQRDENAAINIKNSGLGTGLQPLT